MCAVGGEGEEGEGGISLTVGSIALVVTRTSAIVDQGVILQGRHGRIPACDPCLPTLPLSHCCCFRRTFPSQVGVPLILLAPLLFLLFLLWLGAGEGLGLTIVEDWLFMYSWKIAGLFVCCVLPFWNDREIVRKAVGQNREALKLASDELQNERE